MPPLISVSCSASPPARLRSHTCAPFFFSSSSPRDARNARYLPSGLQRGVDSLSLDDVSCTCSLPSQLTIQTSRLCLSFSTSVVLTVYATHLPSGDRWGSETPRSFARSSYENGRFVCALSGAARAATRAVERMTRCFMRSLGSET